MVTNFKLLNGSVFSAMQTDINNRNQADLVAEEERDKVNNLDNVTALVGENKFLVSDKVLGGGSGNVVLFNDPKTKQRVALKLDEANLKKLKESFEGGDFYERKDGAIRLNGKAESFVSGWFGDIAYKQGYLEADSNKYGIISGKERDSLKTSVDSTGVVEGITAVDSAILTYRKGGENSFATIQEALNDILDRDKNLDGSLERIGEYQSEEEAKKYTIEAIQRAIRNGEFGGNVMEDMMDDMLSDDFSGKFITEFMTKIFEANKELTDNIQKMMEEYRKKQMERQEKGEVQESEKSLKEIQVQQQALRTLKNNGGNMNALNAEQKKSLAHLTQKDSLSEEEMQALRKQVDKGLISVVDSIRTQVRNGDVSLLDKMA